jgi:hypothetical protein
MLNISPPQYDGNVGADVDTRIPVTICFLISPNYEEIEDSATLPGCIGELQCGEVYLENGGAGCTVRQLCEGMAWEQYGPGGYLRWPWRDEV